MAVSLQTMLDWSLARLQEPSTWRGAVVALTAGGIAVSPDLAAQISAAGLAFAGLIEIIRKENKS